MRPFPGFLPFRPRRAVLVALAMAAAPGLAGSGAAQGRPAQDAEAIASYRLTMPVLRKVLPAMAAPGAERCERRRQDPASQSLTELARTLEACPPVAGALRQAGVPLREAALAFAALLHASQEVARQGGKASALPPGAVRDNAMLVEQHDAEIRKLAAPGGRP